MLEFPKQLYLASQSPRRAELLRKIGLDFIISAADIDEDSICQSDPVIYAKTLAEKKAEAVLTKVENGIIVAADTIVTSGSRILGKPSDKNDAHDMLKLLSGKFHSVFTAFTIIDTVSTICVTDYAVTRVKFKDLTEYEIKCYIDTGSPFDKAGAYGIQDGVCSLFIEEIQGCYYNVMGFPLNKFYTTSLEFIKELNKQNRNEKK